jgi:hypothetical protein
MHMPNATDNRSRMPDIGTDDIIRAVSERLPDVDMRAIDWPKIDSSTIGKAVTDVAAAAHIGRRSDRRRWPLIGGLILTGVAVVAILSREGIRTRIADAVGRVRDKTSAMLPTTGEPETDARAFDAADTMPIEADPFAVDPTSEATGYPDGLGSNGHDLTTDLVDVPR